MIPILIKRDFTSRVKGAPYIITTIIGILVFVGLGFAPLVMQYFAAAFSEGSLELLVVDYSGEFYPAMAEVAAEREGQSIRIEAVPPEEESAAYQRVLDEGMNGLLLVDLPDFAFLTPDAANYGQNAWVENLVNQSLTRLNARNLGLSAEEMAQLFSSADLQVRQIGGNGDEVSSEDFTSSAVLAYCMLFMIYMSLILYGNMVASGVAEEKSSRIMEVMIAKVKPTELMAGKILGIGALSLMQFAIWVAAALVTSAVRRAGWFGSSLDLGISLGSIEPSLLAWFVIFFILGFFFYASIYAAGGAVVSRVEEVNQVVTIVTMLIAAGFIAAFMSFTNPNGRLAVITSLIPFTSPMVMFARLTLGNPAPSQVAASVLLLILAVAGGAWFSGRVYRIGVLLYGKRPTLREIVRYLRA
ncbi:MAG: ABC transporter permease [Limnochordia bacterium]|jgi:ABC-2 type transport system permease protein|nr:MAG: hypothetical protein AA931_07470 [Peptococcaceae bacterium 1109]